MSAIAVSSIYFNNYNYDMSQHVTCTSPAVNVSLISVPYIRFSHTQISIVLTVGIITMLADCVIVI